jgi:hypothetical protein
MLCKNSLLNNRRKPFWQRRFCVFYALVPTTRSMQQNSPGLPERFLRHSPRAFQAKFPTGFPPGLGGPAAVYSLAGVLT